MEELNITQFDKAGVVTDLNEFLLNNSAFADGYNVRFSNGSIETAKGYVQFNPNTLNATHKWTNIKSVASRTYLISETELVVMKSTSYDKVPYIAGFDPLAETYINALSNLPVIVNKGTPYGVLVKSDAPSLFKIPGWGNNMTAHNVVAYKGYLFAFGVKIAGQLFEDTLFWSAASAPDTYPKDWGFQLVNGDIDLTKPITGSSGSYAQLSAIGGSIVAAEVFGDSLYVFTESEIFRVTEIGGTFQFRFQKVSTGKGAVSPTSVIGLENGLAVIGSNELYLFNGQSTESLSNGRISRLLSNKVLNGTTIKMIRDFNEKHLYIFFKQVGKKFYDEALVWDWVSNTFSRRDGTYCQFTDVTEFRADSLLDENNKSWPEYPTTQWDRMNTGWQAELKYGTGVLCARPQQLLIMNRGYEITSPEGINSSVPWSLTRTYHATNLGYPEDAIVRVHAIQFKGSKYDDLRFIINNSASVMKASKKGFVRVTGKEFKINYFGNGYISIPSITIVHSFIGAR